MIRKIYGHAAFALCLLASSTLAQAGDVVVITHPDAGINELQRDEVMRIFLARSKTFPNDKPALPFTPRTDAETRKRFETAVFQKTSTQIKAYWTRLLFTGRGNPPPVLENDADILHKVATTPSAISYIDSDHLDNSVKVVYRVK